MKDSTRDNCAALGVRCSVELDGGQMPVALDDDLEHESEVCALLDEAMRRLPRVYDRFNTAEVQDMFERGLRCGVGNHERIHAENAPIREPRRIDEIASDWWR